MPRKTRPEQKPEIPEIYQTLADTASRAEAAGMPTAAIITAAIGPSIAVLSVRLGRREVAEALHQIAVTIGRPSRRDDAGVQARAH